MFNYLLLINSYRLTLTRAIRAMYPDAKIPIIALSANAFKEDVEKSKKTVVFRLRSFLWSRRRDSNSPQTGIYCSYLSSLPLLSLAFFRNTRPEQKDAKPRYIQILSIAKSSSSIRPVIMDMTNNTKDTQNSTTLILYSFEFFIFNTSVTSKNRT